MGMFLARGELMGLYGLNYFFFWVNFYTFFGQILKAKPIHIFFINKMLRNINNFLCTK
jgi:hypothetical protein